MTLNLENLNKLNALSNNQKQKQNSSIEANIDSADQEEILKVINEDIDIVEENDTRNI